MGRLNWGDKAAQQVSERVARPESTIATLKTLPANKRVNGMVAHILTGDAADTLWHWVDASTVTGDDVLAITPSDAPSTGRWLRLPGSSMLVLPFTATMPNNTVLLTVPSGSLVKLNEFAWGAPSLVFTGASNAAVAVSSSNHAGHTGVGGFLGSAVATNLNQWFSATANGTGVSFNMGLVASGTFDTDATKRPWMKGGDTIKLNVMGANFGTGMGSVLVACEVLRNPGV